MRCLLDKSRQHEVVFYRFDRRFVVEKFYATVDEAGRHKLQWQRLGEIWGKIIGTGYKLQVFNYKIKNKANYLIGTRSQSIDFLVFDVSSIRLRLSSRVFLIEDIENISKRYAILHANEVM
ncbi:hypothetical protein MIDIC_110112 [Alphaproteobacteria bacterium]